MVPAPDATATQLKGVSSNEDATTKIETQQIRAGTKGTTGGKIVPTNGQQVEMGQVEGANVATLVQ